MPLQVYSFGEVKKEIITQLREQRLIPVIGSGFSFGGRTNSGKVPNGAAMKEYMINKIIENEPDKKEQKTILQLKDFSIIAGHYQRKIPLISQKEYIRNNFTKVELNEPQQHFLEINWMYVYTLNIDDAIENCSQFSNILCPNKKIDFSALN